MKLYFKRSNGEEVFLGDFTTIELANKKIKEFIDDHNYKSYYQRIWLEHENPCDGVLENPRFVIDVGSWTEFFHIYLTPEEIATLPETYRTLIPKEKSDDKDNR